MKRDLILGAQTGLLITEEEVSSDARVDLVRMAFAKFGQGQPGSIRISTPEEGFLLSVMPVHFGIASGHGGEEVQ